MSRDRDRYRSHYSRERDRERERSRERDRHVGSDRYDSRRSEHREHKDRDRNRDRDREKGRDRDRDRERERDKHRSSRDRSRSRSRSRSRTRSRERDRSKHRDRKSGEGSRRHAQPEPQQQQAEQQQPLKQQQTNGLTADQQAEAHKKKREAEQDALDAEMEERRKRVEEWRKKRAAEAAAAAVAEQQRKAEEEAAAAAAAEAEAGAGKKGWSLEDDDDDDEPHQQQDDDEPDPLDAFMAGNAAAVAVSVKQEQQQQDVTMTDADAPDTGQAQVKAESAAAEDDEPDPLDAFMAAEVLPEVSKVRFAEPAAAPKPEPAAEAPAAAGADGPAGSGKAGARPGSSGGRKSSAASKGKQKQRRRFYDTSSESDWSDSEEEGPAEEAELDDETWAKNVTAGKLSKGEKLGAVDHSAIDYPPFRRRFYIEVPEIQRMTEEEVAQARKTEGIKVRGVDIPRPVKTWTQCGINVKVLEVLKKHGFERPLSIQAQALPIIMSGRDCIGIAKTGSGKTLAFVLPMLRHIRDQPELRDGDGPIALIMAPTRELVQQIAKEVKRFGGPMMISCTPVFGGAGVANQISELKRGTEVVAATPGRLIDLLVSRVTNMRRVTYLVLDEADRMFDMGFEPQITRIVSNIRPDRQTVMFSATFPRAVETLARLILNNPVEIQVGGRSVVNADIAQFVEIRPEADRFLRLLEILGEWYEVGKIIIFVHTQDKCDNLFRDLLKAGYPCLSLHGGKEQSDRECTIADFKGAVCNILVATSIAARGLDVRDLVLVVNYDVPNHHEDYVHRVGRTGRAGNKGTAITFIGPDEDRYAPDLVKALKESSATVPQDLQDLADTFMAKKKQGLVQGHGSGFGGSGFKFDKAEDAKIKQARKSKAKEFGIVNEEEEAASESEDDDIRPSTGQQQAAATVPGQIVVTPAAAAAVAAAINGPAGTPAAAAAAAAAAAVAAVSGAPKFLPSAPGQVFPGQAVPQAPSALVAAATAAAAQVSGVAVPNPAAPAASSSLAAAQAAAMRAAALAAAYAQGGGAPAAAVPVAAATAQQVRPAGFESEIEINDFPQNARWKVTHKGFQQEITDLTGAAVTTKGIYVAPGAQPPEGERKLFLLIEAPTEAMVRRAKQEIRRVIEELVEKAMRRDVGAGQRGRYNIM